MISVSVAEGLVPPSFEALICAADVPATVGIPLMIPEVESTLKPVGRPVAVKLYGAFVPAIW